MSRIEELKPPQQHHNRLHHSIFKLGKLGAWTAAGALAIVGAGDVLGSCQGGPIEQATQVNNLGATLDRVAVPEYPVGIMEGEGVATGEVIQAKYLHIPDIPVIGFLSSAANGVLEKLYQTSATSQIDTNVEVLLNSKDLTLKPYKVVGSSTNKATASGLGVSANAPSVEADVNVDGLTSVLVDSNPTLPKESSGEGLGNRTADIVLGNGETSQTDNAATVVAQRYFQHVCGRALLSLSSVGVEKYVQNIFKLDSEFFAQEPNPNQALDKQLSQLATRDVYVVFTHDGRPISPATIGKYVNNFGPSLPDSKNIARLVGNTPGNVKIPGEDNDCMSTTTAINQQVKLIQQAAIATSGKEG